MPGTALVREVLRRASVLLLDDTPQFNRWTESELVDWLNDAQVAITKYLPSACSRLDVIRLQAGTRQSIESIAAVDCKPGDGSTPAVPILGMQLVEVVRNMGSDGLTPGRPIRVIAREMQDAVNPDWHVAPKVAPTRVNVYTHNPATPRYFHVAPAVPAARLWAEVAYYAQPLKIPNPGSPSYAKDGASTETIKIADEYVDDLVNYVVARAHMKESEAAERTKAALFTTLFVDSLNAKVAATSGANPNLRRLPFAPEPVGRAGA